MSFHQATKPILIQLDENLFVLNDTCNVFILSEGDAALLIDCGSGEVADLLPEIGVSAIEWVLFTHHHREQCQGAAEVKRYGAKFAAPAAERSFFEAPNRFRVMNPQLSDAFSNYGTSYLRPPREPISIDHAFERMDCFEWRGHEFWVLQTPGNSPGAVSYLKRDREGKWLAFTGDLILDGARLHTWFDSEWDYGYGSGLDAIYNSAFAIERFQPKRVFPSHGDIIENPLEQLPLFREKIKTCTRLLQRGWDLQYRADAADVVSQPTVVPHLWQVTSHLYKFTGAGFGGNFHMILSDTGRALFIDCGGWGGHWLDRRIEQMKERMGLREIDAVIITHMHGDHLLDCPHLKEKHGVPIWTLDLVADKCTHPQRFDYTCPISTYGKESSVPIDRTFKRGEVLEWENLSLIFDWLPGQTEFALILHGEIDGQLVAFTGDNIFRSENDSGHDAVIARNGGVLEEGYGYCAEYLWKLQPDLILAGHSVVIEQPKAQLARFRQWTQEFGDALRALSPDADYQYFFDPFWLRADPYRMILKAGGEATLGLHLRNYRNRTEQHQIGIKVPDGWSVTPSILTGEIAAQGHAKYLLQIRCPASTENGTHLLTFDVSLDGLRYGEWFDAIVQVTNADIA